MIKRGRRVEDGRLADRARVRRARPARTSSTRTAARALGTLVSPHSTLEEMALAARLIRALGSDNIDFRLRQTDFRGDGQGAGIPWLGMPVAELDTLDRVLVVGSFLRKDHPLLAQRLRQAAKKGAQVSMLHSVDDDWLHAASRTRRRRAVAAAARAGRDRRRRRAGRRASRCPPALAGIEPVGGGAGDRREPRCPASSKAILLGNYAEQHPDASQLHALAQALAEHHRRDARLPRPRPRTASAATSPARCRRRAGSNAQAMLAEPRKAYLVLHAEPEFDCANPVAARAALEAGRVRRRAVAVPARHARTPTCCCRSRRSPRPPARSSTAKAARRRFHGVVKPLGETRPGWKVLRVLGSMLGLPGFDSESIDDVRARSLPARRRARRAARATARGVRDRRAGGAARRPRARRRRADLLRRSAGAPRAVAAADGRRAAAARADERGRRWQQLGVAEGAQVRVRQGRGEAVLTAARRRRACRRASCASPPRIRRPAASRACPARSPWSAPDAMDALARTRRRQLLGPAWPVVWTLVEDRRHRACR